jgi:hypothetical protein
VSLSWRDEIGAYLAPHRLCLVRTRRGLRPKVVAEHEQTLEPADLGAWTPVLAALDTVLSEPSWQGARMHVVLSDQWARYGVIPWAEALSSSAERLAHARQYLATVYGDVVSDWEVRLSDAQPLSACVACTIPTSLLTAVRTTVATHGVKLVSLQPQLIAAYDSWRHRLPNSSAWFVTVEQGSLAAARIAPHGWDRVHTIRIDSDWPRELKRLQTFGRIASSNPDEGRVYVDAPQAWREVAGPAGNDLHWLEEESRPVSMLQHLGRVRRLAV